MTKYTEGLHALATVKTKNTKKLVESTEFAKTSRNLIQNTGLKEVGYASHDFEGGGYTTVIALSESHISCHTWPEYGFVTLDIFLCNYSRNNDENVKNIFQKYLEFFDSSEYSVEYIRR